VAYFGKARKVRIFTGYMQSQVPQEKFDFHQWPEAKAFIQVRLALPRAYAAPVPVPA
jgi:hypothetical protein